MSSTSPPKPRTVHSWEPKERDALQILFYEYSLHPNKVDQAYHIFADFFPWAVGKQRLITDEWLSGRRGRNAPAWAKIHNKPIGTYNLEERTRRTAMRLELLLIAKKFNITLAPIPGAAPCHKAVLGVLPKVELFRSSLAVRPERAFTPTRSNSPPNDIIPQIIPPAPPQFSQPSITAQSNPIADPSQDDDGPQPEMVADENSLCMVHRSDVFLYDHSGTTRETKSITTRYACLPDHLLDHTSPEWQRGGPVLRLLVKQDLGRYHFIREWFAKKKIFGVVRDVMLCQLGACKVCSESGALRSFAPYDLPFVHAIDTVDFGSDLIFSPRFAAPRDEVVDSNTEPKSVVYINQDKITWRQDKPVLSAVCIRSTCSVCSQYVREKKVFKRAAPPLESGRRKRWNDGAAAGVGPLIKPGGFSRFQSGATQMRRMDIFAAVPAEQDDEADRLRMAHREDLVPNLDPDGNFKPDQPRWRIANDYTFAEGSPGWGWGGLVVKALVSEGPGQSPRQDHDHLMVCDPADCAGCNGREESPREQNMFPGAPFVHSKECDGPDVRLTFNPPMHSNALADGGMMTRVKMTRVVFIQEGEEVSVNTRVCVPESCTLCQPTQIPNVVDGDHMPAVEQLEASNGNPTTTGELPSTQNTGASILPSTSVGAASGFALLRPRPETDADRNLCMVHSIHVQQNRRTGQEFVEGRSKFRTQHQHIFGSSERMWSLGGHVLNISVDRATYNGRDVPAADYSLMVCDKSYCDTCSATSSQRAPVRTGMNWFKGLPFVHTRACVTTGDAITFRPPWDTSPPHDPDVLAYETKVTFFEAGVELQIRSWMCMLSTCYHCDITVDAPPPTMVNELTLRMIHRSHLEQNDYQNHYVAGRQARYACDGLNLMNQDSAEWHHAGSVAKVFVPEENHLGLGGCFSLAELMLDKNDPAGEVFDVMLCQLGSCEKCTTGPTTPHRTFRLPFVHSKDCVFDAGAGTLTFNKDPLALLDMDVPCEINRAPVIFLGSNGMQANPLGNTFLSAVCKPATCAICRDPAEVAPLQVTDDSPAEDQSTRTTQSGPAQTQPRPTGPGRPLQPPQTEALGPFGQPQNSTFRPEEQPQTGRPGPSGEPDSPTPGSPEKSTVRRSPRNHRSAGKGDDISTTAPATKQSSSAPSKGSTSTATNTTRKMRTRAPSNPLGPGLRMCHRSHLKFKNDPVTWDDSSDSRRPPLTDNYYLAESNTVYQYGGAAYRITLPTGAVVDAMCCVGNQCGSCQHKNISADVANSPTNGEPFVHRSHLVVIAGLRTFAPSGPYKNDYPKASMQMQSFPISFPQAGKTVPCHVCVVGSCVKCDGSVSIGAGGRVGKTTRGGVAKKGGGKGGKGGKGTASVPFTLK